MRTGSFRGRSRLGEFRVLLLALAAPALLAGCVAAGASPSVGADDSPYASTSGGPTVSPSNSPSNWPSATPTATPTETPTATPPPTATPTPGPQATADSGSGRWTGIGWTRIGAVPELTPALGDSQNTVSSVNVYGWSRGYVGFVSVSTFDPDTTPTSTISSTSSTDARHWTADRDMDAGGLTDQVAVTSVLEGPSGLLAIGRVIGIACGGPSTVAAMWTSTDGLSWSRVSPPVDFASASVYTVDGGASGFVASGTLKDGTTQALWLSSDGRNWHTVLVPRSTFGAVVVQGASVFGSGYVVSGAVLGDEGCGGPQYLTPSLWWSSDGRAWSRATLSGAAPASDATMTVTKISARALMAVANEWNQATQTATIKVWVSADGKAWSKIASPSQTLGGLIRTDGTQAISLIDPDVAPPTSDAPLTIAAVDDNLSVRALPQTGDVPMASQGANSWNSTIGPAGLVELSSDGSTMWLGVPAKQ